MFFFKQKTAYEMRISDWSSDVCSSDLQAKKLGHKVSLAKAGSYSSAVGAKRAFAKVGYVTLSEALDAHLPLIAPASALLGDIIEIEGDGPLGSMGVYVGNGRIFCYHELHDVPVIFQPVAPIAAWRTARRSISSFPQARKSTRLNSSH